MAHTNLKHFLWFNALLKIMIKTKKENVCELFIYILLFPIYYYYYIVLTIFIHILYLLLSLRGHEIIFFFFSFFPNFFISFICFSRRFFFVLKNTFVRCAKKEKYSSYTYTSLPTVVLYNNIFFLVFDGKWKRTQ